LDRLNEFPFVVLGFQPTNLKQYGILEIDGKTVKKIVEWKYWQSFSKNEMSHLGGVCNTGIYAARLKIVAKFLDRLEKNPHVVIKERNGRPVEIKEYFITDLVELMIKDGIETGYTVAPDEKEVMGIDDPDALKTAQELYRGKTPTD
jgi:bifunctional N-acetylglucosamine-1-phosphate-uridyltransferase/glucosamine-1-phosphate-acetyltransferase GlmU-like protein